jgi:hypothetical protein
MAGYVADPLSARRRIAAARAQAAAVAGLPLDERISGA